MASLIVISGVSATFSNTIEVSGVKFENTYTNEHGSLTLAGAGLLRLGIFFRAYAAAFYLSPEMDAMKWHKDTAKCLTIHYFLDIKKEDFGPAGREILARMYSVEELQAIEPQLQKIDSSYKDISEGERYTLEYFPEAGTRLLHNGVPVATIPGAEFPRYYFSIWLGEDPIDKSFRDALLGKAR